MRPAYVLAGFLAVTPVALFAQSRSTAPANGQTNSTVPAAATPSVVTPAGSARPGAAPHTSSTLPAGNVAVPHARAGHAAPRHGSTPTSGSSSGESSTGTSIATTGTDLKGARPVSSRARGSDRTARGGQLQIDQNGNQFNSSTDFDSVPGLGFDYAHVAATHPNRVNARRRGNVGAVLFPFFDGGYFIPGGPAAVADKQGDARQTEEADEDTPEIPARSRRANREVAEPATEPPAPQHDVPEYVFVRRDGTVFFAVAYAWESESLRYVSSEGVRRSIARETLDLGATQEFNEQRGMTFRSPT